VRRVVVVAWITVLWCALWGDVSAANVVAGAAVGLGLAFVFPPGGATRVWRVRPLRAAWFVAVFIRELVEANVVVLRQVLTFRSGDFREAVIAYRTSVPLGPALLVVLGDAITLTPGTMTIDMNVEESTLFVHVLHVDESGGLDAVRQSIGVLERAVIGAFT
jgi:multicomponent Na+:H+ antiporter subunit E